MLTLRKRCMLGFCRIYQHMIATFWAIGPSPDLGADAGLPVGIRVRALGVFTRRDFWVQVSLPETPVKLGQCPGFCMYLLPGNRSCETSLSEVTARGGSGLDPESHAQAYPSLLPLDILHHIQHSSAFIMADATTALNLLENNPPDPDQGLCHQPLPNLHLFSKLPLEIRC